jgi:fructose transport system substrate-binding protein
MRDLVMSRRGRLLTAGCAVTLVFAAAGCGGSGSGGQPVVGLITKTDTNPFFVKMKEGAQQAAGQQGVKLQTFAGMLVIALDTPTDPANAVDATFATDNYQAGKLVGQWAKAKFAKDGKQAKIAMLDLNANQVSVDVKRDQGFFDGFGVAVGDPNKIGDENDPRIVGHDVTNGNEDGGRTAMENLLQKDPSINLVYTINEPAAAGAYQALKSAGKDKAVTIVSIDGGCPGVDNVKAGVIGATSMQFPLKMASLGVEAIAKFAKDGTKPQATAGKDFVDTGVQLITDQPQAGVEAKDSTWGKQNCWG